MNELEDADFYIRRISADPYHAHWNGHCNHLEMRAAEISGLLECSDIDREENHAR